MTEFQYTPEMDARLVHLVVVEQMPMRNVADTLFAEFNPPKRITRNSVIGRYNRLKNPKVHKLADKAPKLDPNRNKPTGKRPKRKANVLTFSVERAKREMSRPIVHCGGDYGVPLAETTGCRFAVSPHDCEPHEHKFCNADVVKGSPYCRKHFEICYRQDVKPVRIRNAG